MPYAWLATSVLLLHVAFILFVALGGLAVLRWPRLAWLHLPCVAWGVMVELMGWYCPLTPLENHYLRLAGRAGYEGDFLQHYLLATLYPEGLTRQAQTVIGLGAFLFNALIYGWLLGSRRWSRSRREGMPPDGDRPR